MLEAIIRLLITESASGPLAIIVEDVHWLDARSEELLVAFGEQLAAAPILLLVNYRPEYRERWKARANFIEISLKTLTGAATESLLSSILGDEPKLAPVKHFIAEVTEGNPFFAEEMVRDLLERGVLTRDDNGMFVSAAPADGFSALKVPNTLQGVLASRIDALAPSYKELLQRLSIFGREFPSNLVPPFADRPGGELERELEQLQQSGFIYLDDSDADAALKFKHSLTQQVAYNSMTADRRKVMHARAGRSIEEIFANRLQDHYSELAFHFSRSDNLDKGIDYLGSAGNQAMKMAAIKQAIGQFREGLALLGSLPSSSLRDGKELSLRFWLASTLWQAEGPSSQELQGLLNRVVELVKPDTDPSLSFGSLQSLVMLSCINAEYSEALVRCDRLTSFAEQMNFPIITMLSLFVRSNVRVFVGELVLAQRDFEEAIALYEPLQAMLPESPTYLAINSLAPYGPLLCILGYPDRAVQVSENTIATARSRSNKYNVAYATYFAGFVSLMREDRIASRRHADEALALASEFGFPTVIGAANVLRGWCLAHEGEFAEGVKMVREGILEFERTAGKIWHATLNAVLLNVLILSGKLEEAALVADQSIEFCNSSGERVTLAELWRAKGNIFLAGTNPDRAEAEKCFRRAVQISHEQGARFFELRAANDLSILLRNTDCEEKARSTLREVYETFTEGFETPNLIDAKASLGELRASQ